MSKIKVEAFLSDSDSSKNVSRLLEEIGQEYGDTVEIVRSDENSDLFKTYNLGAAPTLIIEEMIRFIGFCPSKDTFLSALRDVGMEQ